MTHHPWGYALLFLPYGLATIVAAEPRLSYWIAWSGSLFILYLVLTGRVRDLPRDRAISDQVLRPVFLTHIAFAAYTALSSLPYFMEIHGFYYLARDNSFPVDANLVALTADAQRYYVLAHAAFVSGILVAMNYRDSGVWRVRSRVSLPVLLLIVSALALAGSVVVSRFVGAEQLVLRLKAIALFGSVLTLAVALPTRRVTILWLALAVYLLNFANAVLSGWKKEVVVVVLLLVVFAFPYYRRTVLALAPIVLIALVTLLPAYNATFRELSWTGTQTRAEAARTSAAMLRSGDADVATHTWAFLAGRASEIGLFVRYIQFTPAHSDFAGFDIARQAMLTVVPRALWPAKPDLESMAMERAYNNYVVDRASNVSAKPQFVVDAYLSAGAFGVLLACFLFGTLASLASRLGERWFGGYMIGTGVVYTSLFLIFWSGNSFEFTVPVIFWSFTVMWMLALFGRALLVLVPYRPNVARAFGGGETAAQVERGQA